MVRNAQIDWRCGATRVALPALIVAIVGGRQLPGVFSGGLINPDSYMRMVRLQETFALQQPAYVAFNDGSGHGTLLHWSHLLDMLICLLAAPFALVLQPAAALHAAAILAGPISIGALGYAVARAAAPFTGNEYRLLWLGPVIVALSPAIGTYAMPGVVHHHVPIIVALVMAGSNAARIVTGVAVPGTAAALGVWCAVAIWLTPETIPLVLLIFGGLWLAWLIAPARRDIAGSMLATGGAFLLIIAAAFAVDPPYAGYAAIEIDRLSILFVGLAGTVMACAATALAVDRAGTAFGWRMPMRATVAVLSGAACFGAWAATFPVVLHGTDGMLSPVDWHAMFDHVSEMQPVKSVGEAMGWLLTGTLATLLLFRLALRHRSIVLLYVGFCAIGLAVVATIHIRFTAYPETLAAIVLPVTVAELERRATAWHEGSLALARVAIILLFVVVPQAGGLPALSHEARAAEAVPIHSCTVSGLAAMLAPYAGEVVLANVNDTPELLYRTGVRTVGSLYHRNMAGFLRLRAAWRSGPSESVPRAISATEATLVLFCPEARRSLLVSDLPPDTLADRLKRGAVPPWLHQVAADAASGNVLYRIVP